MDIPYVDRSAFLEPCERVIRLLRDRLDAGEPIRITLDAENPGYPGSILIEVRPGDASGFAADFESSDPSRFPARIRAAATALHHCGCSGRFLITHVDGVLEITKA